MSRQALIEVMERATAVPVVFLSAGPGWGKTTLLAEWAARSSAAVCVGERRRQGQRPDRPADVCRDRARPRLADRRRACSRRCRRRARRSRERSCRGWAQRWPPPTSRSCWSLDDLHLLHDRTCLDAVATLARHVRDGSQLALSARGAPALELGALRARGLELETRARRSAHGRRTGRRVAASGRRGAAGRRGRRAHRAHRGLVRGPLSRRAVDQGPHGAGTSRQTASPEAISWCRTTCSRSCSPSFPRTSSASSPGPPCSTGCRGRCATRSWRSSGSASALESLRAPTCSWCRSIAGGEWYRYHHLFQELLRSALSRARARSRAPAC